jgi:hypothetical protein
MTGREVFNEQEWLEIRRFPVLVAALISAVDYSSVSEFKEFNAFATFIHKAGAKRKKSPLIAELLEDTVEVNVQVFLDHCQHVAASLSGDKPVEVALNHARDIGILVDERLPKKVAATYKGFVMEVAVVVARAHKESLLPFASSISKVEDYHIRRLGQAIRV